MDTTTFALLKKKVINELPDTVSSWLGENIDPDTGYVIDSSFSVAGAAADAKATGDALTAQSANIENITGVSPIEWTTGGYIYTGGAVGSTLVLTPNASQNYVYAIVNASAGDNFCINGTGVSNAYLWTFIDSNDVILSKSAVNLTGNDLYITAPTNASKLVINSSVAGKGQCFKGESISKRIGTVDVVGNGLTHRIVAGVVRNSGDGWEFIVDDNHQGDLNCISVSTDSNGRLVIDYSGINATKVISFMIQPDEAFSSLGYICGSSTGKTAAYVDIYKYAPIGVYGGIEAKNDGTLSILDYSEGLNSVSWDSETGRMTITHDNVQTSVATPSVIPMLYSSTIPRLYSQSGTSITLEFIKISDGTKVMEVNNSVSVAVQKISPTTLKLVKQNASQIVSSAGNFWFMGIFQTS